MARDNVVSTKVEDYLTEDPPIRGQEYVCLSFLSPEDVIANKEVYYIEKFLASFHKEANEVMDAVLTKYPDAKQVCDAVRENHAYLFKGGQELQEQFKFFKRVNAESIEREFNEDNAFRTSVRGIKVRGVYDSVVLAQQRAQQLKKNGDNFDIFVGQVGCWCPWSPNADDLQDQEYAEAQLNTLMREYRNNMTIRDREFEERKQTKVAAAKADAAATAAASSSSSATAAIEGEDPWLASKSSTSQ